MLLDAHVVICSAHLECEDEAYGTAQQHFQASLSHSRQP